MRFTARAHLSQTIQKAARHNKSCPLSVGSAKATVVIRDSGRGYRAQKCHQVWPMPHSATTRILHTPANTVLATANEDSHSSDHQAVGFGELDATS